MAEHWSTIHCGSIVVNENKYEASVTILLLHHSVSYSRPCPAHGNYPPYSEQMEAAGKRRRYRNSKNRRRRMRLIVINGSF